MPLVKNNISINFQGGMDDGSDSQFTLPGSFLTASNVVFDDSNLPRKRYGYTEQTITPLNGTIAANVGQGLVSYSNTNKALLYLDNNLYSYVGSSSGSWALVGEERNVLIDKEIIYLNQSYPVDTELFVERIGDVDCLVYGRTLCGNPVAQVDGNKFAVLSGCEVVLRDRITDQVFYRGTTTTSSPSTGADIWYTVFDITNPLSASVTGPFEIPDVAGNGDGTTGRPYHAFATYKTPTDNSRFLACIWYAVGPSGPPGTANDYCHITFLDATGSATNNQLQFDENTIPSSAHTVGVQDHNSGSYWFTTKSSYDDQIVHLAADNTRLWGLSASFDIRGISPLADGSVVAIGVNRFMTIDSAGSEGTISYPIHSGTLSSRPFQYDGQTFALYTLDGKPQSYAIMDISGNISSIDSPGYASASSMPIQVLTSSGGRYDIYQPYAVDSNNTGVVFLDVNFSSSTNPDTVEFENTLYRGGSYLKAWDDFSYREAYFLTTPEIKVAVGTGTGLTGTYLVRVVLEYLDVHGKVFRSSISNIETITLANQGLKVNLTGLKTAAKQIGNLGQAIRVKVFRSVAGGTVLYNSKTSNSETTEIIDTTLDSAITSNEILYTIGGELSNDGVPSSNNLVLHGGRMWTSDERELWYTKPLLKTEGPGFSLAQTILCPEKISGLASLDDKLIIFSRNKIYYLYGQGPDATGVGSFSEPELINSPIGCIDFRSIVEIPEGIVFQSKKGIWLLTRALQPTYIGQPLEGRLESSSVEITSTVLISEQNEVRFNTKSDGCFVYNFETARWSTFPINAIGADNFKSQYHYLTSTGSLWQETTGSYVDNYGGSDYYVTQTLETGWINFAGLSGRERLYELQINGKYSSPHYVTASIYYNEDDSAVETQVFACNQATDYPLRIRTAKQRISSFRIRLSDSLSGSTPGEGARWKNMTALVGAKGGLRKKKTS